MNLLDTVTGELVEFDRASAERRAERITLRLDAIADNYRAVLPLIREAIEKRDDIALGYRSPGEYVADRFGQSLAGLGVDVRRAVVGELTEAGLSTRAIAAPLGVSEGTVRSDLKQVRSATHLTQTPASDLHDQPTAASSAPVASDVEQAPGGEGNGEAPVHHPEDPSPRSPVTGIDGKTYPGPATRAKPRKPLPDVARDAGWELRKAVERLERITADDRFGANKEQVASQLRGHLTNAVEVCQTLLDRINESGEA